MDEDCPLAAAIRSGERDDLMWAIFRKMKKITDREQGVGYSRSYQDTVYGRPPRTHCRNGHEWTAENVRIRPTGHRTCRVCERLNNRRWRAKKRTPRRAA
jgi:hypothetical protein